MKKKISYTICILLLAAIAVLSIQYKTPTKNNVVYFGNEVTHDIDHDGRVDKVFIVTQNTGTSTSYYVVASLNTAAGYVDSEKFFLGNNIAPQTTEMSQNPSTPYVIVVNYADTTTSPSVAKSVYLKLDIPTMQFGVVEQNFEGEADPKRMTLDMTTWNWVQTTYSDDTVIKPKTDKFSLTFKKDNTVSVRTDCNSGSGEYTVSGSNITFTNMISTEMYCEGSQEQEYAKMLSQIQSYMFTSKGELVFDLKLDTGSMIFR